MHMDWDDPSAGEWIAPLLGTPGSLGGGVPEGYEAHVRLPNSADPQDNSATLVQRSSVSEPDERDQLDRLLAVLAPVTGGQVCHFAMWSGWAWLIDADADPRRHTASVPLMAFPAWTTPWARRRALRRYQEQHADSLVRRPRGGYLTPFGAGLGQDFMLYSGPLAQARRFDDFHASQSPSMFWPHDRSWFVWTDIDSAFTVVGGAREALSPLVDSGIGGEWVDREAEFIPVWESHP
ncbi:hypothetical protein [Serinibacter salmoneus]|uniref:Uncharacterized protein n=1 Tax=Serinibacter salmoneus TaxID=556530 RepID=A0A2A9D0P1_9MICO|nr:hypothetical protein [Serinibacter salmoneus]PFG20268.1 hypothetical protein ATL40_1865 [Serinibacter salmoneus]